MYEEEKKKEEHKHDKGWGGIRAKITLLNLARVHAKLAITHAPLVRVCTAIAATICTTHVCVSTPAS